MNDAAPSDKGVTSALQIPFPEFIALSAMLMALTALSIDIMLPALPRIASEYELTDPNHRQHVVFAYFAGLGVGQILFGTLSDRLGRRPVMLIGLAIYIMASALAVWAPSFETLLAARAVQGFGGAAPRVVLIASVRDLFIGRQMARVMSLIMIVFLFVPVVAPSIGQILIYFFHWNAPFYFLFVFGILAFVWAMWRFPETYIPVSEPGRRMTLGRALIAVVTTRQTVTYMVASGFVLGCLTAYIASAQQIFVDIYDLGPWFPIAFGATAFAGIGANFTNSRIVLRLGVRSVSHTAIACLLLVGILFVLLTQVMPEPPFVVTWIAIAAMMYLFGLTMQNFNALAMEPQGRVAGMASSILGTHTTLFGALMGWLVGSAFDGTVFPIAAGFALLALAAIVTVLVGDRRFCAFRRERDI